MYDLINGEIHIDVMLIINDHNPPKFPRISYIFE